MKPDEYYRQLYKLAFIDRYSNRYRVTNENVAMHSFFVAAIVLQLYEEYDFNLRVALVAAISHDIMEADISDVTHDIKQRHKALSKELNKAEFIEVKKYPQLVQDGFEIFENNVTVESLVANLADVIQVYQYYTMEVSLGNLTVSDIGKESQERIRQYRKRLKPYERLNRHFAERTI